MKKFYLQRFIDAQEKTYHVALNEIRSRKKRTHWMWFIFPQLKGLGSSAMADYYGIENAKEASAYLNHPVLGKRLLEICHALLDLKTNNATEVMGCVDDQKLKSCMTLFAMVSKKDLTFQLVLSKYFHGEWDKRTVEMLRK